MPAAHYSGRVAASDESSFPDYRFTLANERTFLAWIRTALGLLAGGVAVLAVLPDVGPRPVRYLIGFGLLVLAALLPPAAYRRWAQSEAAIRSGTALPEPGPLRLVTGGLSIVALLVMALLVL